MATDYTPIRAPEPAEPPHHEQRFHHQGELHGKAVFRDTVTGAWAIERDFELLCEMTDEELRAWEFKQAGLAGRPPRA